MNRGTFELRFKDWAGMRQTARKEMAFHKEQHMQWFGAVLACANHAMRVGREDYHCPQ